MNRTITLLTIVFAFVSYTGACAAFGGIGSTTGTSFENQTLGDFDIGRDDKGGTTGPKHWVSESTNGMVIKAYAPGKSYDYATHGTVRNGYLQDSEPTANKFLAVDLGDPLERTILQLEGSAISNVFLKTEEYDGIYADTLVKFSTSIAGPAVDETDRIIVWLKETELDDGRVETNLMVTAGRYAGAFDKVEAVDYAVTNKVAADTWCRLTIRAISDVTEYKVQTTSAAIAKQAPGFTVYIDGQPAVIDEANRDIGIDTVPRPASLSLEARVLAGECRLFPSLATAKTSKALTLSRFSFAGLGAVDDMSFSTDRPGHVATENVFTLNWDAGIVSSNMICVVSNAASITTYTINTVANAVRYRNFRLGTNSYSQVTVSNVVYDLKHDYTNGTWAAENGCTVTNNVFYASDGQNPIGNIVSSCRHVRLGTNATDGCIATFKEAKSLLTNGVKRLVLATDMVISTSKIGNYNDKGVFSVSKGENIILDLNGHALQGQGDDDVATVRQFGGTLLITDSSVAKSGRILSPLPSSATAKRSALAVKSSAKLNQEPPVLTIEAGWYDGLVSVTGEVDRTIGNASSTAICCIKGGCYTNVYDEAYRFYLEQYATNGIPTYFRLAGSYWTAATNGYVWCGEGTDDRWTNRDNWRGKIGPAGAGDLAIFPRREDGPWDVDFGAGAAAKSLWLDGDIVMKGTNEFADVKVVSGTGRFGGAGMATFTKKLPGVLTGEDGTGEIRLNSDWEGTVRISKITTPKILDKDNAIRGWGNARSKVEFNGVRGYVYYTKACTLPYELILTDDGSTPAWKNDTGFSGSTVSFPKLSGSGTLDSSKNAREVLQVLKFADAKDFTGVFKISGKQLLLGTGVVPANAKAGHITFSKDVNVRSGLGWEGVNAHFGEALYVQGKTNDVLMTYTDKKSVPSVGDVTVMLLGPGGATNECSLVVSGSAIVVTNVVKAARRVITLNGKQILADDAGSQVKSGETFSIPAGSAVTIDGNRVIINGTLISSFADYYVVQQIDGSTYGVAFDEEEATPTLAEFSISEKDGTVTLKVDNAKTGLWYGLQTVSSLAEKWQGPMEWKQPVDDTLTFAPGLTGSSTFFRVFVTDKDPGAK